MPRLFQARHVQGHFNISSTAVATWTRIVSMSGIPGVIRLKIRGSSVPASRTESTRFSSAMRSAIRSIPRRLASIDISDNVPGIAGEANAIRVGKQGTQQSTFVAGIYGTTVSGSTVVIVMPDLVVHDEEGKPFTVRYEAVTVMLLNEFLKEHGKAEVEREKVRSLEAVVSQQQNQASEEFDCDYACSASLNV